MKKILFLLLGLLATPAQAYIGPGTGAGVIATVLGVLGSFVLLIVGLVYYPIKRVLKKIKRTNQSYQEQ